MAKTRNTPHPQQSSAKAKSEVNKMKGAATISTQPSNESDKMKVKKETVVGKDPEVERPNPSRSAKSNVYKRSGDDDIDQTGIESIMKAAAVVAALLGPAKTKTAAPAMAQKKTR
jgi:hypothetical protein